MSDLSGTNMHPAPPCPLRDQLPVVLRGMGRQYLSTLPGGALLVSSPDATSLLQEIADEQRAESVTSMATMLRRAGAVLDDPESSPDDVLDVARHLRTLLIDLAAAL